jgi:hypothetical protein
MRLGNGAHDRHQEVPTMNSNVITLARWLARNRIKAEWRAQGRRPEYEDIGEAANAYFIEHRDELIDAARAHPALMRL